MSDKPEMVLCKDCKHSKSHAGQVFCKHPNSDAWVISPVDGKIIYTLGESWRVFADDNRCLGACGMSGVYFEQKKPLTGLKRFFGEFIGSGGP